jgi:hypothetical protein
LNLNFQRREISASIIVRAGQVIPALPANQLATLRLQALGTNRAETDGMFLGILQFAGIRLKRPTIRAYMLSSLHGPKVIAQPGWSGKGGDKVAGGNCRSEAERAKAANLMTESLIYLRWCR